MPHGYALRFSPGTLADLARLLTNERRCCPFLSFDIAIASNGGPVWLRITGPEGTREFLAAKLLGFTLVIWHADGRFSRLGNASLAARIPRLGRSSHG